MYVLERAIGRSVVLINFNIKMTTFVALCTMCHQKVPILATILVDDASAAEVQMGMPTVHHCI